MYKHVLRCYRQHFECVFKNITFFWFDCNFVEILRMGSVIVNSLRAGIQTCQIWFFNPFSRWFWNWFRHCKRFIFMLRETRYLFSLIACKNDECTWTLIFVWCLNVHLLFLNAILAQRYSNITWCISGPSIQLLLYRRLNLFDLSWVPGRLFSWLLKVKNACHIKISRTLIRVCRIWISRWQPQIFGPVNIWFLIWMCKNPSCVTLRR